jgi:phenylpropionate dioxygenase-like ring-hydroxylating dioxygenase large terminal subunit
MLGDDWASMRKRNTDLWKAVFEEDISVCEGMQRGRASESFDGGRFSPVMDGGVHCFHKWVAKNMSSAAGAST